jgi:dephospho-CoA kinase
MLTIGLTGGIGSGKSAVARIFKQLEVPVFDTDVIARELVEPGQPALDEIIRTFGKTVVLGDGQLNRQELKTLIFNDDGAREQLEAILHPRIREKLFTLFDQCDAPYCVAVIPLLVEHNWHKIVDRVLVVDADQTTQLKRVQQRDQLPPETIKQIMTAQATRGERLAVADDVITNNGDLDQLGAEVQKLHQQYLSLAKQQQSSS